MEKILFCRNCGKKINPNSKFCTNCGKPIEPLAETERTSQYENRKENYIELNEPKKSLNKKSDIQYGMVAIVVLLILIGIGGVLFLVNSLKNNQHGSNNVVENQLESSETEEMTSKDETTEESTSKEEEITESTIETEESVENTSVEETEETTTKKTKKKKSKDYILKNSNKKYLTKEDIDGFTEEQCRIALNELYARHGRLFHDESLQAYFDSKPWYHGTILPEDFNDNQEFNNYEIANRDLIVEYEKEQGYR